MPCLKSRCVRLCVVASVSLLGCSAASGQGLVPKHIAAPPSDIEQGIVRLPDSEYTGIVSSYSLYEVGRAAGAWEQEINLPAGADIRMVLVGDASHRATLEKGAAQRTLTKESPAAISDGRAVLHELGELDAGTWILRGNGTGHVFVADELPFALYANVTSHEFVKGRSLGVCARLLDMQHEDGLRVPTDAAQIDRAVLELKGADRSNTYVMRDDGQGLDARAGDGVFTATVPTHRAEDFSATVRVRASAGGGGVFERTASLMIPVIERRVRLAGAQATTERVGTDVRIGWPVECDQPERVKIGAELWAQLADGRDVPVCWIGGIVRATQDDAGRLSVGLLVDPGWVSLLGEAVVSLELRNVRLQDVRTGIVFDRAERMSLVDADVMIDLARDNHVVAITKGMLAKHPGTEHAVEFASAGERAASGHNLMLVHGYCTGGNPYPTSHFTGTLEIFSDPDANRSHDAFAQLIGNLGSNSKSFGVVAHSQGGMAALHLYTFYWSGLDWADGPRLIQSVGTPYQGTPLAGDLAGIGGIFGQGCGENFDLSPDGAPIWLASIPSASRQKVFYYTTSFEDQFLVFDFCNLVTDLVLSDPDDGVIEMFRGQLPGANNRGHVEGWCHTSGMRDPAQTIDFSRNTEMNANAAR